MEIILFRFYGSSQDKVKTCLSTQVSFPLDDTGQFQVTVFSRFYYVLLYVIMNISIAWTIDKLKIT